jgi:hypothetical protein
MGAGSVVDLTGVALVALGVLDVAVVVVIVVCG